MTVKPYYQLFKPGLALSIVLTALPGLFSGSSMPEPSLALATILGTMLSAMASFGYNQIIEQDRDALMERTRHRVLVTGEVSPYGVYILSSTLLGSGLLILGMYAGPLPMLFALSSFIIYIFAYTIWLKPRSWTNTLVGAVAGAVGPLIGESAAKGRITEYGVLLFLFVFLWQMPHFWALACYRKMDYATAGFPMLPVVKGEAVTAKSMILYQGLLILSMGISFFPLGLTDLPFALTAIPFACVVMLKIITYSRSLNPRSARTVFFFTIFHNLIWHGALTFEQIYRFTV